MILSTSLLLSAMLMTQAQDIADDLNTEPLKEQLYLFDVNSDASVDDLKGALGPMTLRHSFRVIGESRYLFVALARNEVNLRDVNFPGGSTVTQYPVEHLSDFFKMFGVTCGWDYDDKKNMFDDFVMVLGEWEFLVTENTPTAVFTSEMAQYGRQYAGTSSKLQTVGYATVASYPPKMFNFALFEPNAAQHAVLDGLDALGGPRHYTVSLKFIVKV